MRTSSMGGAPWRAIVIQGLVLLGLAAFFKFYLPHHERDLAALAAVTREQKIQAFFQDSVVEDPQEISIPLDGAMVKRHPQSLRATFSPQDAESALGIPDSTLTDFRGGEHLVWNGTAHKLGAAFDAGHLYSLTFEDRATGRGVMVYESPQMWHPY